MILRSNKIFFVVFACAMNINHVDGAQAKETAIKPTRYLSLPLAAAGAYGSWKLLNNVESTYGVSTNKYALYGINAAITIFLATNVSDYSHTLENYSIWSSHAVATLEEEMAYYQLLIALYKEAAIYTSEDVLNFSKQCISLINQFHRDIQEHFEQFDEISWQIGEQDLIRSFTELRKKFDNIAFGKCASMQELVTSDTFESTELKSIVEDFFVSLRNLNLSTSANNISQFNSCSRTLINFFTNEYNQQQNNFENILRHCKRVEKLSTIGNMIHGGAIYVTWYLSELFRKK